MMFKQIEPLRERDTHIYIYIYIYKYGIKIAKIPANQNDIKTRRIIVVHVSI